MALGKDALVALATDLPTDEVKIRDGQAVRLRALTSGERFRWMKLQIEDKDLDPLAALIVFSAIGEDGQPLFKMSDVHVVASFDAAIIEKLSDRVAELSGIGGEAVEDAGKDSETTPNSETPSGSPESSDAPSENSTSD